jgi:hypothetical protein
LSVEQFGIIGHRQIGLELQSVFIVDLEDDLLDAVRSQIGHLGYGAVDAVIFNLIGADVIA